MDATEWDARYSGRELVWGAQPNRWIEQVCSELTPGRALDLACGEGRNAIWLASMGWTATGVDFSAVALRRGAELAAEAGVADRTAWQQGDLLTYRPEPGAFDLVVLAYLQLPADGRGAVVRSAAEALADGGTLLVVAHDSTNLADGVGGPQDPAVLYTAADVQADLRGREDLTVLRAEAVLRPVAEGPDGPDGQARSAVDALFLARRG